MQGTVNWTLRYGELSINTLELCLTVVRTSEPHGAYKYLLNGERDEKQITRATIELGR